MRFASIGCVAAIFLSSLWIGCGDEEDLGECPTDSAAAQAAQAAGHDVIVAKCVYCHSSQATGTTRQGAPEDLNFDKLDVVRSEAGEMYEEAESGSMPPSPAAKVTGTDLENMRIWLACGAKETSP